MAAIAVLGAAPAALAQVSSAPCFEWNYGNFIGASDELLVVNNQLGFTFPGPGGVPVTSIDISSNGFIWLGSSAGATTRCCNGNAAAFVNDPPSIAAMWEDLDTTFGGAMYFGTIPGTPARAVITWESMSEFYNGPTVTVQVQLVDNGEIIIYHESFNRLASHTALVGVTQGGGATPNPVVFTSARNVPIDTGSNPTAFQAFTSATYDLHGKSFEFIPNPQGGYTIHQRLACDFATYWTFGAGCPSLAGQSFYEDFQPGAIDLSNTSIAAQPNGLGGWVVLPGSGQFYTGSTNALVLQDDDVASGIALPWPFPHPGGVATAIDVSSNGFIWFDTNFDSRCCNGDRSWFLSSPPSLCGLWMDLYPPGGGSVYAEADPSNSAFYITWDAVPEYFNQGANTFQIALFPNGGFELRYGAVATLTHNALVGYTSGNGSLDPGPTDLTTALPIDTGRGGSPLRLDSTGNLPVIGTTFTFTIQPIPANTAVGAMFFGLYATGRDLAVIGMPGCKGYVDFLTAGATSSFVFPVTSATEQFNLLLPNAPPLIGTELFSQAATLSGGFNALGVIASNGMQLHIGS